MSSAKWWSICPGLNVLYACTNRNICMRVRTHAHYGRRKSWYHIYPTRWRKLTHLPLVTHICVSEWGQHLFRQGLVAYAAPSHYLNECWVIVNWNPRKQYQWNFNQNTKLFIPEIASQIIVCGCGMPAIFSGGGVRFVIHWLPFVKDSVLTKGY